MNLRQDVPAIVVTFVCVAAVCVQVARAAGPPPRIVATAEQRQKLALVIRAHEAEWNDLALRHFPADHWSQRDDFHGQEMHAIIDLAAANGFSVEDVLRAIDDDVHANGTDRNAGAVPCKPRPFYD